MGDIVFKNVQRHGRLKKKNIDYIYIYIFLIMGVKIKEKSQVKMKNMPRLDPACYSVFNFLTTN